MDLDRLIYMANQIARNIAVQGEEQAVAATAEHIRLYWDPRMRAQICAHNQAGGGGLDPLVRKALDTL